MEQISAINEIKRRVIHLLQQIGWFNTGFYMLSRFLLLVSYGRVRLFKYYLLAQPVVEKLYPLPGKSGSIKVREICEDDVVTQQFPRPRNVIQNRFNRGAKCLVAFQNEEFVGFLWLQFGYYQEDEVRARFVPLPMERTAWDFDVYIVPNFRFGRAFVRLWAEANNMLCKKNITWSCSRISAFNYGSLRSHRSLGAKSFGSAIFFCVGKWQVSFASIFPYFHISLYADSFPKYRLKTQKLND